MYLSLLCDGSFDSLCCDDQVANSEALSQELHFLQGTLQLDLASRRKLTRMQAVTKTVWGGVFMLISLRFSIIDLASLTGRCAD